MEHNLFNDRRTQCLLLWTLPIKLTPCQVLQIHLSLFVFLCSFVSRKNRLIMKHQQQRSLSSPSTVKWIQRFVRQAERCRSFAEPHALQNICRQLIIDPHERGKVGPTGTDPLEENKPLKFFKKKKKKNITQLILVLWRCAAMPTSTQLEKQRQIAHVARLTWAKLVLLHQ